MQKPPRRSLGGLLFDERIRENFVERIFTYQRWQQFLDENPTRSKLVFFHTSHKSTLMAHYARSQNELGRLVAAQKDRSIGAVVAEYGRLLTLTMKTLATKRKHTNTLQHLMGFLKIHLDHTDKRELIEQYRMGNLPLVVPLTILQHHLNRNPVPDWVKQQVYLNPYPKELSLKTTYRRSEIAWAKKLTPSESVYNFIAIPLNRLPRPTFCLTCSPSQLKKNVTKGRT
jgi:uncharacterized protein YbgA (DUF1722 family)